MQARKALIISVMCDRGSLGGWQVLKPKSVDADLEALDLMSAALKILDECNSPGDIGAHLDFAVARLREHMGLEPILPTECSY